jgi:hypothetical protein
VRPPDQKADKREEVRDAAQDFLKSQLADGPQSWESLCERGQAEGLPEGTLRKARRSLGLVKEYRGKNRILWRFRADGELADLEDSD